MADLHGNSDQLSLLENVEADIIAFCGDLHNGGTPKEARPVAEALASLELPVLIVPGNMDPKGFVLDLWKNAGLKVLHGKSCAFRETRFFGLGGMAVRNPAKMSDLDRFYIPMDDAYKSLVNASLELPAQRRTVVLSHQPPLGACDIIHSGESVGSKSLRRYVDEFHPDLLICGHIHEDRGRAQLGQTTVVNAGEMRQGFAAIIDLDEQIKVEWMEP